MTKITLLIDYKNNFESRYDSKIYRSGMDKDNLVKYFNTYNVTVEFLSFSKIDFRKNHENKIYLYTSSEDPGYLYKSYIEDVILGLSLKGAIVLPDYKYLRANNNKVFMEILRDISDDKEVKNIYSKHFGTHEELQDNLDMAPNQSIMKLAKGASSLGVFKSDSHSSLIKNVKKHTKTSYFQDDLRDIARSVKHKGYQKDSVRRKKFIVQNFIPDLKNDWKILIYNNRYYVLFRPVRKNDFRASGSGHSGYLSGNKAKLPNGMLDFVKKIYSNMNVPNLSIDVAFDGQDFYMLEFQVLYFGTTTQRISSCYYSYIDSKWQLFKECLDLEKVYVDSIMAYLNKLNIKNDES